MAGERVLIVDGDQRSVRFLGLELSYKGYRVEKAYDGASALKLALSKKFDLVLLDLVLPVLDGMNFLHRLRAVSDVSVIILTEKDSLYDKVNGLNSGADDYLTKPFAVEELLARMRAVLKGRKIRVQRDKNIDCLTRGKLTVCRSAHSTAYGDVPVSLTNREFDLLWYLLKSHDAVCSRSQLMQNVWGYDFSSGTNLVDVYIRYLRNKLDYRFNFELIHTVRGVGYMIRQEEKE